jgi:hypothetical protein
VTIRVKDGRLRIGERLVPLISGEVHFWRLDPVAWDPILERMVEGGIPIVATYLSWRRHEPEPGRIDLSGQSDARLDVRRFVERCRGHGLYVHLKPGPWICSEEPNGGYPGWLLADTDLLALDAAGRPIVGYETPWEHPVPSYLHPRYLALARRWLRAVDDHIRDLVYPRGPIVMVQLDNEPSYAFRDSMYGADYHPLAIERFRRWALRRHGGLNALAWAWSTPLRSPGDIEPPRGPEPDSDVPGSGSRRRAHDWVDFRTWLLADHLRRLREIHVQAGLGAVLFTANYNEHLVETVPQDPGSLGRAVRGIAGPDLYFNPPLVTDDVVRLARTIALARAAREPLRWAPEIQAGIWRAPGRDRTNTDPTLDEQAFWLLAAVAFGLQGMNLYMLADRERWDLAPIAADGRKRGSWPSVQRAVGVLKALTEAGPMTPVSRVAVLVDREHQKDSFVALGSGRSPDAPDSGQPWQTLFRTLLDAGHLPTIWFGQLRPEADVEVVVCPPDATRSGGARDQVANWINEGELIEVNRRELSSGHLGTKLQQRGTVPPVRIALPDGLACLHRGSRGHVLFVVHWGHGSAEAAIQFADQSVTGTLVPLIAGEQRVAVRAGVAAVRVDPRSVGAYALLR